MRTAWHAAYAFLKLLLSPVFQPTSFNSVIRVPLAVLALCDNAFSLRSQIVVPLRKISNGLLHIGQPVHNSTAVFCLYASVSNSTWFSGVCDEPKPFFCRLENPDNAETTRATPQRMSTYSAATSVFSPSGTCHCSTSKQPQIPPQQPKCPFGWDFVNQTMKCYKVRLQTTASSSVPRSRSV